MLSQRPICSARPSAEEYYGLNTLSLNSPISVELIYKRKRLCEAKFTFDSCAVHFCTLFQTNAAHNEESVKEEL